MAVLPGLYRNYAVCWGWHEGRFDGACLARLVCRTFPLASTVEGQQMKTPDTTNAESSAPKQRQFTGTDNPRHLRAIAVLLRRPMPRESLDRESGASNSPELVAELRRRGLTVPCERIRFVDRDGCTCRPGVYSFTLSDRRKTYTWLAKCRKGTSA